MMANLSEDIQCADFDTRPPMLDRSDFESWKKCICLYCLGKDNGENILKSINEGPFKMGKFRETLAEGAEEPDIVLIDVFTRKHLEAFKFIVQLRFSVFFGELRSSKKHFDVVPNRFCFNVVIDELVDVFGLVGHQNDHGHVTSIFSELRYLKKSYLDEAGTQGASGKWYQRVLAEVTKLQ
nr:integrase, catalytic region, zinc finger, CCHC-type, peptidase aspartic, catalytic [Tanacetum cinerariifolium]